MKKFLLGLVFVFSISISGGLVAQDTMNPADDGGGGGSPQCRACTQMGGTCSTYYASELDCVGSFYTNCCKGG